MIPVALLSLLFAQSFEVATVKPSDPDSLGRFIRMQSAHQFQAKNHVVKTLIAAAYNLNPKTISGGPDWVESDKFDILAETPGDTKPGLDQQMAMLRKLLSERFKLQFHREKKEFSIYSLTVAKGGPKLKASESETAPLIFVVFPTGVRLPAKGASMAELASVMQRAVLDRPVVDNTGLTGRFDFDFEFVPDDSQFGGQLPHPADSPMASLFTAIQQQLGLRLEATRGMVEAMVIDHVERPGEN
jgi:uncharacterized protein (TIGR03435 family)